jgi:zinc/manganese transport system permease protein
MTELLSIMWVPFLACLVLVTIHAYLGIHVLARGVIFVDLALAQIAALGATIAVLAGYDLHSRAAYLFSLGFTFLGAFVFAVSRIRLRGVPQEAIIGVTYAVASSAAILAVNSAPHGAEHIKTLMVGSILWVTPAEVLKVAGIYGLVGLFHWLFRDRFFRISLHPAEAEREGLRVRWWDFLFYASFGFVVTSSVEIAGVLLVFSFLIVPGIIGILFAGSIRGRLLIGWSVGWLVSVFGCLISYGGDLPTGATVVCTFGLALLLAILLHARVHRSVSP